jgi:hypothetical protein
LYDYYAQTARQYRTIAMKPLKVTDRKKIAELGKIKKAVVERFLAEEQARRENALKL